MSSNVLDSDSIYSVETENSDNTPEQEHVLVNDFLHEQTERGSEITNLEQGLIPVNNSLYGQSRREDGITKPEPFADNVSANVSKCESVQLGNKFVADKITFVIGNPIARSQSQSSVSNSATVFDSFKMKNDVSKLTKKKYKLYLKIVNLCLLVIFVSVFFVTINKALKISEMSNLHVHSTSVPSNITPNEILSSTLPGDKYSLETTFQADSTTKGELSSDNDTVRQSATTPTTQTEISSSPTKVDITDKNTQTAHPSTRFTSVTTTSDNTAISGSPVEIANTGNTDESSYDKDRSDATTVKTVTRSKYETEPHYNESILILSKIYRGFQVQIIPNQSLLPSKTFKSITEIRIEFYLSSCQFLTTCLTYIKQLHGYPTIDYNFLLLEDFVYIAQGWKYPIKPDSLNGSVYFNILIMLRDSKQISEKQMYLYLILINSSIRCGYLETNFNVMIKYDKRYRQVVGYSKFINIINNSTKNRYYVDESDYFVSDSKKLSNLIPKPCPAFKTCNNTCDEQECLQTVCDDSELCVLQCL